MWHPEELLIGSSADSRVAALRGDPGATGLTDEG